MNPKTIQAVGVVVAMTAFACSKGQPGDLPQNIVGHCTYVNNFSQGAECRDYHGAWSEEAVRADCKSWEGEATVGSACNLTEVLGYCVLGGDGKFTRISLPGADEAKCASSQRGCELFGGGSFDPAPVCGGAYVDTGDTGLPTFQQPQLACVDPVAGEPLGTSADGKVCTWEAISGATEEGRDYRDYASCDRVRTQRPYYPARPSADATVADSRLDDPTYATEQQWVRQQIQATACVCCHSNTAPKGPSNWFIESKGNFINSFFPRGLAMGAGWINTVGFGAYPKAQNNGFSRADVGRPHDSIFVTTDPERMKRFFEAELAARGLTPQDFAAEPFGAGPLDTQRFYQPKACENGEGIDADGTLRWQGGKARYVYVLEAGTTPPTVPPNLDLPEGTLWRLDVPSAEGTPVDSGTIRYGTVPADLRQRFPLVGGPAALTPGKNYLLYVTADVVFPIARCVFTAP